MGHDDDHQLSAAYALNALDEHERAAFEEHLRTCETCRSETAELRETTAMLAYAVAGPEPPRALRNRILDEVRAERRVVVPLRRPRFVIGTLSGFAAAAAAAAIVLAVWAASLSNDLDRTRAALAVLGDPSARTVSLQGASGRLVVDSEGQAALVVRGLDAAPRGRTYEVWIIEGERPRPAGLFRGEDARDLVLVDGKVPRGAVVAVTEEAAAGAQAPTGEPLFTARA